MFFPAIVPYILAVVRVILHYLSVCIYNVFVSWTAVLAIQINPCVLCVCVSVCASVRLQRTACVLDWQSRIRYSLCSQPDSMGICAQTDARTGV